MRGGHWKAEGRSWLDAAKKGDLRSLLEAAITNRWRQWWVVFRLGEEMDGRESSDREPPQLEVSDIEKKELRRFKYEKERSKEQDIKLEHKRLTAALEEKKKVCMRNLNTGTRLWGGPGPHWLHAIC